MEILILGGILVALMVYTSTRIKRSAARAFERETIDADEFTIIKPDGFINPLNEDSPFAFEAYTKLFGEKAAKDFRHAHATLKILPNENFKVVCAAARAASDAILSEYKPTDETYLLEGERTENDVKVFSFWKIVAANRKIYELKISVLEKYADEFADRINEMIESFRVK